MFGSLARRERRAFWTVSSVVLAAGIGFTLWAAAHARAEASGLATNDARVAAQTKLTPLLLPRDLTAPVTDERGKELTAEIERTIASVGPIDEVRIYSSVGRILYAEDPGIVGTRPSYLRDRAFEVANGQAESWVRGGLLQTHVPIWLTPGGTVVVAELSRPFGPIAAEANGSWYQLAIALGVLFLVTTALAVSAANQPIHEPIPIRVSQPAPTGRGERERRPAAHAPVYEHPGFRAIEEQRQEAERRAAAAETNVRETQAQLREALIRIEEMEAKLTVTETQTTQNDGELQALRDQVRETAGRLHEVELDNNALRERLALRKQELEEAWGKLAKAGGGGEGFMERLAAAEHRAAELEEVAAKLEAELEYTKSRLHMTMLTQALREIDNDDIQIEENGHSDGVIVRRSSLRSGKVR